MRTQIKKLHQRMKTTVVYVTHDQIEAMTLADRIVVMNAGRIEQVASPQEMYDNPATRSLPAHRLSGNEHDPCTVERRARRLSVRIDERHSLDIRRADGERYTGYVGKAMLFGIRPEHITEKRAHFNDAQRATSRNRCRCLSNRWASTPWSSSS